MSNINGDLLLGIDIGTTGTKCSVYNFSGRIVATAYQDYPMIHPQPNWTEQDPRVWWACVCKNLHSCFGKQGIDSGRIAAIGVSCTNAVTLVDANGEPLYNAIGLHDRRSWDQLAWLEENVGKDYIRAVSGNRFSIGTCALTSMRWLIENRPELIEKGHKFLMPSGYVIQHLTGEFSINTSRVDLTTLGNIRTGQWEKESIERAQFPERLLPKVYKSTDIVGLVTEKAAAETGLKAGTPVTAGSVDTMAATVGAGTVYDGDCAITIGSSGRLCFVSDDPSGNQRIINSHLAFDDRYLVVQTTDNAGVSLRWFRDVFGPLAFKEGEKRTGSAYDRINEVVAAVKPDRSNIIYLPYLSGEKSPIWDADARGLFFNIGLGSDFGAFARAVMEGVAFSIRDCANLVTDNISGDSPIPLGGGIANSRVWSQIFADVLGRPMVRLKNNETETLGDIIIAANAIGLDCIPKDYGKTLAAEGEILYPNKELTGLYDELFAKYKDLYESVKHLYIR